jgi:YVTN family beta-propeller protein
MSSLAVLALAGTLVVLNKAEATASLVDLASGSVVATVPTGKAPHEVAASADGRLALATNYGTNDEPGSSLTLIDVRGARVVRTIGLGSHRRPHGVRWLDARRALVTAEDSRALLVVDAEKGEVEAAIPTEQNVSHMVALAPGGGRAFVSNIGSGGVTVVDLAARKVLAQVPTGAGAEGIDITPDGRHVWVTNREVDTVSVIDAQSLKVIANLKSASFPIRARVTPDGRHVLVSNARSGDVTVFADDSLREARRVAMKAKPAPGGGRLLDFGQSSVPIGIVVEPDGRRAYVAHANADEISILDLERWEAVGSLRAGKEPDGMAYSTLQVSAGDADAAPLAVGSVTARRGEAVSGWLEVPDGADPGARIPVSVVHGAKPGPVLALVAGTHGYEYTSVVALPRVLARLDPARMSGSVILVHMANPPGFYGRRIYYGPDGKNLNRVYPGRADGSNSERIAHAITTQVIERATHVADLHCGDGNESLRPYSYWQVSGNREIDAASKQMALAFGLRYIVMDRDRPKDPARSMYTSNTAILRGKPAITTESGGLGQTDEASVAAQETGALSLVAHLGIMAGPSASAAKPVWIDKSEVLLAPATGVWRPAVEKAQSVVAGTLLGRLLDPFGRELAEIRAPFAGEVLYVVATPPVSEREPVAFVGQIAPGEPTP